MGTVLNQLNVFIIVLTRISLHSQWLFFIILFYLFFNQGQDSIIFKEIS